MTDLLGSQTPASPVQPAAGSTATVGSPAPTTPAPTTPAPTSTGSGTGGSFPQTSTGNSPLDPYMAAANQILAGLTPGTFSSDYGVTSSQMPTFLDASGKLNSAAAEWVAYHLMSQPDRQNLQDILVTAGMMKSVD